jgi:prepilin-type N-terminal cleavage/methylation domain-containing protein
MTSARALRRTPRPARGRVRRPAFTMLELVVAMIVMATGLLAIQGLMVRQSRQISHVEEWCRTPHTYYVSSQANEWMKSMGAPADLSNQAGQSPWQPSVTGTDAYVVSLQSVARSPDGQQLSARATLGSE